MPGGRAPKLIVVLALLALPACAGKQPTSSGAGNASISITSPADGARVDSPVQLAISVTGAEIGAPETGNMHFHVHVGGSDKYQVLTSTSGSVPVPAGQQTLTVVLAEPNHDETDVSVVVGSGGAAGGGGGYGSGGYGGKY